MAERLHRMIRPSPRWGMLPPLAALALLALQLPLTDARGEPGTSSPKGRVEETSSPTHRAELRARLQRARGALQGVATGRSPQIEAAVLSATHEIERLEGLLRPRRPLCDPTPELLRLERALQQLGAGEIPHQQPGLHRVAYRSPLDRKLHDFALYVPRGQASGKRSPLIVMLHGMGSSPMRAMGRLFGLADRELREPSLVCDRPGVGPAETMVVAPGGFGDALYRTAGEVDVRAVVRRVEGLFRIDPRRITITGLSMGGTGAVEIALQHPHRYAGVLALCGYYDRHQDSSIQGHPLLPWEKHLMTVHSPVSWARNGAGLPLVLVHGERDGPGRARRLEARYRELSLPVELELYPRGHDVWEPGYQGGRAFRLLGKMRRGAPPRRVDFVTGRPRINRAHWVTIRRFRDHGAWAEVHAEVVARDRVTATTRNVAALHLRLPRSLLAPRGRIQLRIDGEELALPPQPSTGRVELAWREGRWAALASGQEAEPAGLRKRPGLSGPLEDIAYDPVVVVYGTGGGQGPRLRAVAARLARLKKHVTLSYPVLPDRQFSPAAARRSAVILVGNEASNSVLARLGARLPIRVLAEGVRLGQRTYAGPNVGATFIYPNPEAPARYLRVVGGTSSRSYDLIEALPVYLPDYVIFDEGMAIARPLPILGRQRSLLAGGSFDEQWRLAAPPLSVAPAPEASPPR